LITAKIFKVSALIPPLNSLSAHAYTFITLFISLYPLTPHSYYRLSSFLLTYILILIPLLLFTPSSSSLLTVAASAASLRSTPKECSQVSNGYFVEAFCQRTTSWVTEFSAQHKVAAAAGVPEQFWINYGFTPDVMVVGYITSDMTAASTVKYGTSSGSYPNVVSGNSTSYTYGKYKSGLIHHVWLTGLTPNTKYYYQAGSDAAWSQEFTFTSNPGIGPNIPFTFAVVADIGENANANSTITHVLASAANIDSVIIAGDISYASGCEANGCTTWDAFQTMAAPLAAIKPWQINIGNHGTFFTIL
jgi:hypothetical protein